MKIVNIQYTGIGGLASVVNTLATAEGSDLHEWVMAYYGVSPIESSHLAFCEKRGFRYSIFYPKPRNPWIAWLRLASWLISLQPDAIICHSITAVPPCIWVSKRNHIRLIVVEHTPNEVKSTTEWLASIVAMYFADHIVVLTDIYARILSRCLGPFYISGKVCKINNAISTKLFYPSPLKPPPPSKICVGMAGRLSSSKRQDLLIDVASDLPITLMIAGNGDCMEVLRQRAIDANASNVIFSGTIPEVYMPKWFRSLDIYLHASNGETFSMAILQAMASGLPIIASDISGMDEVLGHDGECGFLVANTRYAWRNALCTLTGDPDLRIRMGMAASRRVKTLFDSGFMLRQYLNLAMGTSLSPNPLSPG